MKDKVIALDDARAVAEEAKRDGRVITQDGIAAFFASRYAGRLRYCHSSKAWFEFDGSRWRLDETNRAFEFVRQIAREVSEGCELKEMKEFRKTAFAAGVERFARGDKALAVTAADWDRNPYLLGTPGGTVDLSTGLLQPALASDGITKSTAVTPSAYTDCPVWQSFLREATNGDADLVHFLQQWAGYCLTGDIREHALVFAHGPGGNGKSVFLNTIAGIMGDYAQPAPCDAFTVAYGERHSTDLAGLRGARLVHASETEPGRTWAETRIKQLTGGDEIAVRFMRCNFFKYRPTYKLMIIGNNRPKLEHVDAAIRRRFNIVPFTHQPARPDLQLEDKLREEWPEILRWMIRGCIDWQRNGLRRPQIVLNTTDEYLHDQDLLSQWLDACCDVEPSNEHMKEMTSDLHRSWCQFLQHAGEKPESEKAFVSRLEMRLPRFRSNRGRGFKGIRLRSK